MQGFIERYFLDPIKYGTGYNVVNTVVYAFLLGVLVYLTIRLFKRVNFSLDSRFYTYFVPFLYLGSSLRVLRDYDVITSNLFKTPGIYILIYILLLSTILLGLFLERANITRYHYIPLGAAFMGDSYSTFKLLSLGINPLPMLQASLLAGLISAGTIMLAERLGYDFLEDRLNQGILFAHLFDASATYMGISFYGLTAQHVLPRAVIAATHPSAMFILKLGVVLPVLYYLKDIEDNVTRNVIRAIVLTLGLAPGLRDIMMIMVLAVS
jgi:uncharacterized membrane protein